MTIIEAIRNSQRNNEISVVYATSIDRAYQTLLDSDEARETDNIDYVDTEANDGARMREVWGWDDDTPDGEMTWRVHIIERAATGAMT